MERQNKLTDNAVQKRSSKKRLIVLILGLNVLFSLFIFFGNSSKKTDYNVKKGADYASLTQLVDEQKAQGFVKIGRFGNRWPARLVETIEADDGVSFIRKDGTPHRYQKFDGYRLRVLRLEAAGGEEVILVLRSEDKRGKTTLPVTRSAPTSQSTSAGAKAAVTDDDWEREMRLIRQERAREGGD